MEGAFERGAACAGGMRCGLVNERSSGSDVVRSGVSTVPPISGAARDRSEPG